VKEIFGYAIAGMFSIAFIVFFALHRIPLEVFAPVATGAVVWIFKDIEHQRELKRLKDLGVLHERIA
jgi:hypothetical protein